MTDVTASGLVIDSIFAQSKPGALHTCQLGKAGLASAQWRVIASVIACYVERFAPDFWGEAGMSWSLGKLLKELDRKSLVSDVSNEILENRALWIDRLLSRASDEVLTEYQMTNLIRLFTDQRVCLWVGFDWGKYWLIVDKILENPKSVDVEVLNNAVVHSVFKCVHYSELYQWTERAKSILRRIMDRDSSVAQLYHSQIRTIYKEFDAAKQNEGKQS